MTGTQGGGVAHGTLTPSARGQSPSRRIWKLFLRWGVPAGILAVLAYVLLSKLSPAELTTTLSHAAPEWLLLGLLFYACANVVRAVRMACLLGWPYSRSLQLVPAMLALSLFNNVLPMRAGELSFPYLMQRDGVEWGSSLAALLVSRLFDLLAVGTLFLVAAAGQYAVLPLSARGLVAAAAGCMVVLLALLASLPVLRRRLLPFLRARLARKDLAATTWRVTILQQVEKAAGAVEAMHSRRVYWTAFLQSVLIWLGTYAWFAGFLRGVGLPTAMGQLIFGASFAVLSKSLPIGSIAGFGAHEAGWTFGFVLVGQEVHTAILGGLAVNVLTLLSSALLGLSSLGWLALRSGRSLSSYLPGAVREQAPGQRDGLLPHWQWNRESVVAAILVLFVVLGSIYSVVTPLFETPDEVWHYLYVKHIADGGGLPVYHEGATFPMRQEASQPPLYYLLNGWATGWIDTSDVATVVQYNPHAAIGAPAEWGNRNVITHTSYEAFPYRGTVLAAHLSRFLSVLMGAATVLCTYATARRLFPRPEWLAPAAAALNAFLPQFIFISASINNDVLATLLAALSLWLLVCVVQDGASAKRLERERKAAKRLERERKAAKRLERERKAAGRLVALGAVLGLAALTKLNALVLMPLAAVVLIALAWRRRRGWAVIQWGAWTFVAAALVGGWWYLRNWLLYGDPFGLQLMFAVMTPHAQRPTGARLLQLLDGALKSFFGVFGWFNIVMEPWIYVIFEAALVVAALGLARFLYLRAAQQRRAEWLRVGLLALWSAAFLVALVGWTQARYPQGRLLFPAMPAIATLLVLGLAQWIPAPYTRSAITILLVVLLGFATVVPYRYIAPAYTPTGSLTATELAAIPHPMSVELGGRVRLLGYDLSDETIRPGSRLWVVLYWEGLAAMEQDYSVFVQLLDDRGVIVAQRDSYPGAGSNPTRDWEVGESIRDVYPLDVPATLLAQAPLRVALGFYDYATGQRLPVEPPGGPAVDSVELPVQLGLERPSSTAPHELDEEFGGSIVLTGFSVQPLVARPGDTLRMTLRWQALKTLDENYTVFVHLMRTGAQIWAQNDHWPVDGQAPTSTWTAGQVVMDEFDVHISPDAPEDDYELIVGLYESATVERLSLPSGLDFTVLGKIAVRSE